VRGVSKPTDFIRSQAVTYITKIVVSRNTETLLLQIANRKCMWSLNSAVSDAPDKISSERLAVLGDDVFVVTSLYF